MTVNPCAEQLLSPRQWCRLGENEVRRMWRLACEGDEEYVSFFAGSGVAPDLAVDPNSLINIWFLPNGGHAAHYFGTSSALDALWDIAKFEFRRARTYEEFKAEYLASWPDDKEDHE